MQRQSQFPHVIATAYYQPLVAHLDALSGLVAVWHLDDASGIVARVVNPALAEGRNLLLDGNMEEAGTTRYTAANAATLSKQTTSPHGGAQVLRVARNTTNNPAATQTLLVIGKTYRIVGWCRSDGSATPRVQTQSDTLFTGTTSTSWQPFDVSWTTTANQVQLQAVTSTGNQYVEFDDVTVVQTSIVASSSVSNTELLVDGNMEAVGTASWTASNATLTKEIGSPHAGTQSLRVTRTGASPRAQQAIITLGKRYRITGWFRGDGNGTALPRAGDGSTTVTGTNSTSWQFFEVIVVAANNSVRLEPSGTTTNGHWCEFDDVSCVEIPPMVGVTSGATVNVTAQGRLKLGYSFDGVNDVVNIYSGDLNSAFNPDAGTWIVFAQVSGAGVWTDGAVRQIVQFRADDNNRIRLFKPTTNNNLTWDIIFGSTTKSVSKSAFSPTGWFMMALTWDKSADQMKAYVNGVQEGATQTGLGTWVGNLSTISATIGASSSSGASPWNGFISHPTLLNFAATAEQIARIAVLAGVA